MAIGKYKILLTSQIRAGFNGAVTPAFTPPTCDCPCAITDQPTGIAVHQCLADTNSTVEGKINV